VAPWAARAPVLPGRDTPRMADAPEDPAPTHSLRIDDAIGLTDSVGMPVIRRGLDALRLAVLGILITIGLSVGFGIEARWYVQIPAGLASFAAACLLVWWEPSRHRLMGFVARLTR
jgi:hypothetical protein